MAVVLDALASYVLDMLTKMGRDEVQMLFGVSGEIKKMGTKLNDLKNFLADADRRNITDQSVQAWVGELRDAMYEATNILDICQLKAMERGQSHDAGCLIPLLFCMQNPLHAHKIGSRIKNLNQRLDEIKKRSLEFGFINLNLYEDQSRRVASSRPASRETSGELDESSLVGEKIEEDTRNLVEMLTAEDPTKNENNKIMVFAIVGVGGIGKTTLAQKIYNHDIIQQEFPKRIWLSVNKDFSQTELLRRALIEAGGDHQSTGNVRTALEKALKNALNGQKTLIVMDDVWDPQAWEGVLKIPINAAVSWGCRVLVTTRHDAVARGLMAKKPYHRVNKLAAEDAWLLLKKQVIGNENDESQIEQLKDIGMEIIAKCDCLPLAVKVIGGLLRHKKTKRRDWENVLNDWIRSVSQMHPEINYAVYLSYEDLDPCLKPCFLHYSLLPHNKVFFANQIVGMWISEGFILERSRDLEEVGKEYYDELIQRNLIEPNLNYVDQAVCNMHDIVKLFAQFVARNEALVAQNREIGISGRFNSQKFIRLSLLETGGPESCQLDWCSLQAQPSLRTLISVGHIKIIPGDSLLGFSNLRTLHVEDANFDTLAESLNQLKHLRYLSIARTNTSRLPETIGEMKFLQYISLLGCKNLLKLPASISKLQQLRYLSLTETSIKYIQRGFSGLTSLRKLQGFPADMNGDWCSLEELGPLSHLMELRIGGLENVSPSFATKARLAEKVRLSSLRLKCTSRLGDDGRLVKEEEGISRKVVQQQIEEVFDELAPPPSLENLQMEGYFGQRLPRWMTSTTIVPLWSLRILIMRDLAGCMELSNGLCQLPYLEILKIIRAPAIKRVGSEFLQPNHHSHNHSQVGALFPRLSELVFSGLVEWEEWEWEQQVKAMPILEKLHLHMCKLRHVPPCLAFHASALKKLYIYDVQNLSSLENFISVVDLDVRRNTDLKRISNLPKLQKLIIVKCPKLKLLEGMPALQRLTLLDCDIQTVPRYLQDVNPRHLLLHCSLSLLTCIAAGKSGPEWNKFSHIQQVEAYANDQGIPGKLRSVLYTRNPFLFETNISRAAIARARTKRTWFPYKKTCPVGEEWPVGPDASRDKHLPLCLRFRCNAYRHLVDWLWQACLHCSEARDIASSSEQWTEAAGYQAGWYYQTTYGRLQQQKEMSRV
ncbi:unnamed protein product [Urochloa decumbens]|uniref:Uncharacterized protein n=1 Tax=Urochloa decumbens TaxID=240449 RepID=A0ABC9B0C1_9POAL